MMNINLGPVAELTEAEARERLKEIIRRDAVQTTALLQIGNAGFVPITPAKMSFHNRGTVSELIAAADLASKGFHVYRALSPGAPCDLVALDKSARAIRVEVKTGTPNEAGRICVPRIRRQLGCFDILAVVFSDGKIEYRRHSDISNPYFPLESPDTTILSTPQSTDTSEVTDTEAVN